MLSNVMSLTFRSQHATVIAQTCILRVCNHDVKEVDSHGFLCSMLEDPASFTEGFVSSPHGMTEWHPAPVFLKDYLRTSYGVNTGK